MEHPLRQFRRAANVTLDKLAADVGVTKGYLSKIETGEQLPSMGLAARISAATNGAVTPNDFLPFRPEDACSTPAQTASIPLAAEEVSAQ